MYESPFRHFPLCALSEPQLYTYTLYHFKRCILLCKLIIMMYMDIQRMFRFLHSWGLDQIVLTINEDLFWSKTQTQKS